jgi:Flp pilus assembly protein TadG
MRGEGGQVVILTALLMTVLLFSVGIAFDLGTLFVTKRTLQEAVDAAAFGGAVVLYNTPGANAAAITAAKADYVLNGFPDPTTDPAITSQTWTSPYTFNGANTYIDISITMNVRVPLLPAEGGLIPVTVRSTAGAIRAASGFPYSVVALNTTAQDAFWVYSSGIINANVGNIQVNSNHSTKAAEKSGGTFTLGAGVTAKSVGAQTGFGASWTATGQPIVPDPLAGYLRPTAPACPGASCYPGPTNISSATTLNPGVYNSTIAITGAGSSAGKFTVTFNPGMYILKGGLTTNFGGYVDLVGTDVTFFNTAPNYPTMSGTCGTVTTLNNGNVNIGAPTLATNYYFGMLIFEDPYCTQQITIGASGTISVANGSVYAKNATVLFLGGGTITIGGHLIADKVQIGGLANVNLNYDGTTSANPMVPSLVK